jgi:hypothetical protein
VVARARRIVGDQHDSTVKFRPVTPAEVSKDWAKHEGFKLEADASEKGIVKSASLTMPVSKGLIKKVAAGDKKIGELFSKEQRELLHAVGGQEVDFDSLTCLGPLEAHRWKFEDPGCPWRITAELWKRPDGKRLMEVSIKCPADHAAVAIAGFMAFLAEVGAEQDTEQQSKTRWSLDHYVAAAKAEAKAAAKAGAPEQAPTAKA